MTRINFGRLIIGGLIATVILFITDGLLHEHVQCPALPQEFCCGWLLCLGTVGLWRL